MILGDEMNCRFVSAILACSLVYGTSWQGPGVAIWRRGCNGCDPSPVGKKIIYRYSYTLHANGHCYSFDETKNLPLTVNGRVRFAVDGDKLRVIDEHVRNTRKPFFKKLWTRSS
jgi:hypothetical protein